MATPDQVFVAPSDGPEGQLLQGLPSGVGVKPEKGDALPESPAVLNFGEPVEEFFRCALCDEVTMLLSLEVCQLS
jgi:hypothetical protein